MNIKVPFLDVKYTYITIKEEIDAAISKVLHSGKYILDEEVEAFEQEWASYCEARFCVAVSNGMDAIILALKALDISSQDEIIVPAHTYIATWLAASYTGAKIVPVDINIDNYLINIEKIEESITEKTKVIIPVHLYGHPVDIGLIKNIAKKYNLYIVEDAAQAHGALYKDNKIGSHGDVVCWSFYPSKNLGAFGDAGAITTNNYEIYEKIKMLRNYGSKIKYFHDIIGFNMRMDPIQAAILRVKLRYLDKWNEHRTIIANIYNNEFQHVDNIVPPKSEKWAKHAWHLYVIRNNNRDKLKDYLLSKGIECLIHYPIPPYRQKAYSNLDIHFDSSITDKISHEILSLPIGPHLNENQIEEVVKNIKKFVKSL
ncbi:MAG: DegT/DnrJ/EryC1/StrS family aminotransferase [Bacteroidetes bacterium]|nr:DegT/DnrJ/EryC1/StrS family aminotransferase [Rhodothermia bacterium]MCX7907363.1 DegT/DnrJ/EryC1/StrS family aminotransferase [Bacteroidota bacterium]MDW8137910.1 DegT/DnrJ/EryC1/StrS family aminotransferase [Bacteroidota bacterium]MDW8286239.1 DegT/DnrJ/EryC1/StrS family aminotransferase [Bacteroidota bacterium]